MTPAACGNDTKEGNRPYSVSLEGAGVVDARIGKARPSGRAANQNELFPGYGPVGCLDIGREAVLAAPARVLGHSHFLLDIVERLACLHRRTDPVEQQL